MKGVWADCYQTSASLLATAWPLQEDTSWLTIRTSGLILSGAVEIGAVMFHSSGST